jgi:hypothetical protein
LFYQALDAGSALCFDLVAYVVSIEDPGHQTNVQDGPGAKLRYSDGGGKSRAQRIARRISIIVAAAISPGRGCIQDVQNVLPNRSGSNQIEGILVR